MKKLSIGILAHVDSGKTTLTEAMMYCSGNISKLGRVDHKDSFLDTYFLERDRGITIFSKQAVLKNNDAIFYLLDTPGHVDFSAETERTLQVLDYAVMVVSGTDGVQSHTITLWKLLQKYGVTCFLFVNKMDLPGADRTAVLNELKVKLSDCCVDFSDTSNDEFFECVALCDEELLSKYEENNIVDFDIIEAIADQKVFPVLYGSALRLSGINDEKINQIRVYSGEKFTSIQEADAGTVCAVTGISFTHAGDGLGIEQKAALPILEPVLTYTVILPENVDAHTALSKIRIIEAEDPQLNVMWNELHGEIQVQLMGEIQLEVLGSLISDRFGFNVTFGKGRIIYKETIQDTVEGVGHFEPLRHYAEVHLILKPAKRDSGLVFNTCCKEDLLDKNWQRLIITHLYEKTHLGVLTGSPITDMEITLAAGKAHPKHTEGGDFRQATYRAVRQGLREAKSVLLEPVYDFTLEVPSDALGRAMNDIQRMSGSFDQPHQLGDFCVLTGIAPVSEMQDYSRELVQYTHGKGRLSLSLKGYEPCHNAEEVIKSIAYDPDADVLNPCDSIFCSHGAGHNVKWNEVKQRMHLSSVITAPKADLFQNDSKSYFAKRRTQDDIFALDKELMSIFEQTYGSVQKRKNPPKKRVFKAPDEQQRTVKKSSAAKYDGEEYLLVDGYNVIFAWNKLKHMTFDGAREALINILCNYQGFKKCELIVVFDAYKVKGNNREIERVNNISVVYTKEAETADMYIEKTAHKLAKKHKVRVVTSDGMEQLIILGNGALRVSSRAFYDEVRAAEEEIRRIIEEESQK